MLPISHHFFLASALLATTICSQAQEVSRYQTPAAGLQAIIDAPRQPQLLLSPKRNLAAMLQTPNLPPIAQVAQPELKLAGVRIHPRTYAASRFFYGTDLWLLDIASKSELRLTGLPAKLQIAHSSWSPDQRYLAFTNVVENGVELWLVDVEKRQARRVPTPLLNIVFGNGFEWLPDSHRLLLQTKPALLPPLPPQFEAPRGPNVQQSDNSGTQRSLRTYPDLLKNESDTRQFVHYTSVQLALLDIATTKTGTLKNIGKAAQYDDVQVSPDGKYILTHSLQAPFSYAVPYDHFAHKVEVLDLQGKPVHSFATRPLVEGLASGADAVMPGMRDVHWRADAPASVVWAEALDGGDPNKNADKPDTMRDAVYSLAAPFAGSPQQMLQLKTRLAHIYWGRKDLALVVEHWRKTRQEKVWRINPEQVASNAKLIFERSSEDRYNAPGTPAQRIDENGQQRLLFAAASGPLANSILLIGEGASSEGDKPFLDRFNLDDLSKTRLFQSKAPYFEKVAAVLSDDGSKILETREAPDEQPNFYLRDTSSTAGKETEVQALTHFLHPYPQLKAVKKELIRYRRKDGVELTADLYLPPNYDSKRDGRLPLLMWAYPQEFKSNTAASQVTGSPYRFNAIGYSGALPFLTQGYAVLDRPAMPIVGEGKAEPNDTYLPQLISNAEAAVDEVVRRGVADRHRIAIGGHSYGAFMTANLLAHTRLFAAGIARSGAYNRTLTPFGFQAEERNFWQAKEVYQAMAPFNYADKIKDALLIIHGEQDNNPGTFPIQSERMYSAVKGTGGNVRLVMLPNESHGYRARESMSHVLYESSVWLDKYVKNAPAPAAANAPASATQAPAAGK